MSRILLAWELGGGYGHLARLRIVARQLRATGHECLFAVRRLESTVDFLEPELGPVLQAPVRLGNGRDPLKLQLNYASLLHTIGFDEPIGLAARIGAWRELIRSWRAEHLIADHSPIALIAARSLGIAAGTIGSGFVPPPVRPFPSFQPWIAVETAQLVRNEEQVLIELNIALARLRLAPYDSLQSIFAGCVHGLLTYPELDHYDGGREDPYLGVPDTAQGLPPSWPPGSAPRVLAYLRPHPYLEPVLQALSASRARVLLRFAEIDPEKLRPYLRPGFAIAGQAINLRQAAQECDAYVNYAAHGTVAEMLLAGKPGVLWPLTLEQSLVARRVECLGAAVVAPPQGSFNPQAALEQALTDVKLRLNAESFAARYRQHDRAAIPARLVERLMATDAHGNVRHAHI